MPLKHTVVIFPSVKTMVAGGFYTMEFFSILVNHLRAKYESAGAIMTSLLKTNYLALVFH